jgi:4-hydroxy-3-polyprenylbenzoate decarboxylase
MARTAGGAVRAEGRRPLHIVVAITGASGTAYGVRLLEALGECGAERSVILTSDGETVLRLETGLDAADIRKRADHFYRNGEMQAPLASGSRRWDAMVVCPCTMSTASKIAHGISDNLACRAAHVALKERRRLIVVPRETPISTPHLRNLALLSEMGVIVLPAMPAFYGKPRKVGDLVDFIVGRILDVLGLENKLYKRWAEK